MKDFEKNYKIKQYGWGWWKEQYGEEGGTNTEIVEEDGVNYLTRPPGKVTVVLS